MREIPAAERIDRLKDVAEINAAALSAGTDPDYEFDYLEISNVDYHGIIDAAAIERLTFDMAPSRARRIVRDGCTIISSVRPNLQAVAHIETEQDDLVCSTGFNVVQPRQNHLHPLYAYYALISENARQHFDSVATGVGYPAVSDKDFGSFQILIPQLNVQRDIASYLAGSCAAVDAAVVAKRQQIRILSEFAESVVLRAVTQGLDSRCQMKATGIDWNPETPRHWQVKQIKRMATLARGQFTHRPRNDPALYDGPYPFIQTGDITAADKFIRSYSQSLNEVGLSVSKMFPSGTLVMSIAANIGDVAILNFDACFPDSMVGMIPHAKTDLHYLYYLMRAMKPIMLRSAVLSTQLNINYVRIGTNFAAFPPYGEQKEIAQHLATKESEISAIKLILAKQIETLVAYRKSLIHECVTGKRRITSADFSREMGPHG